MTPNGEHLVPIVCEKLEPGMYVAELDRSWLHTPFEARGFLITQKWQIEILRRSCEYVYIDPDRSEAAPIADAASPAVTGRPGSEPALTDSAIELNGCREVLDDACSQVAATICAARRIGSLDIAPIDDKLDAFVDHVLEWPDAVQWILATEPGHGYLKRRSVGTAVYAIVFGQHLGFDRKALRDLALGALLLDIGKTGVPITILAKPKRLNSVERAFVRRHVDCSVTLVRLNARLDQRVIDMIGAHHERMDGSGYPHRIISSEIPLYARIAAIADTYDAMTQDRGYARARSGHDALRYLNTWRNTRFDAALVDEFIHAIGIYPVGTNVELTDGSIGTVCRHEPDEPKRPHVLITSDRHGKTLDLPQVAEPAPHRRIQRSLPAARALR
jgi:HD-GYP domain-containing protein (c-di-GMP phosphodiesterase class II)